MITRSLTATTLALAALSSGAAMAQEKPMDGKPAMEKCFGVAPAGQNDCASAGGGYGGGVSREVGGGVDGSAERSAEVSAEGGGWTLNGQKIWTTNAHQCHYMLALVRTSERSENRHVAGQNADLAGDGPGRELDHLAVEDLTLRGEDLNRECIFAGQLPRSP